MVLLGPATCGHAPSFGRTQAGAAHPPTVKIPSLRLVRQSVISLFLFCPFDFLEPVSTANTATRANIPTVVRRQENSFDDSTCTASTSFMFPPRARFETDADLHPYTGGGRYTHVWMWLVTNAKTPLLCLHLFGTFSLAPLSHRGQSYWVLLVRRYNPCPLPFKALRIFFLRHARSISHKTDHSTVLFRGPKLLEVWGC